MTDSNQQYCPIVYADLEKFLVNRVRISFQKIHQKRSLIKVINDSLLAEDTEMANAADNTATLTAAKKRYPFVSITAKLGGRLPMSDDKPLNELIQAKVAEYQLDLSKAIVTLKTSQEKELNTQLTVENAHAALINRLAIICTGCEHSHHLASLTRVKLQAAAIISSAKVQCAISLEAEKAKSTRNQQVQYPPSSTLSNITINSDIETREEEKCRKEEKNDGKAKRTTVETKGSYKKVQETRKTVLSTTDPLSITHMLWDRLNGENTPSFNNISNLRTVPKVISDILEKGYKYVTPRIDSVDIHISAFKNFLREFNRQRNTHGFTGKEHDDFIRILFEMEKDKLAREAIRKSQNDGKNGNHYLRLIDNFVRKNNLYIRPADKNLGLTIMDADWYLAQCFLHLNDKNVYRIETPKIEEILEDLRNIVRKAGKVKDGHSRQLIPHGNQLPQFYIIPKIHKTPISSRPIVASFTAPTRNVSIYIDTVLQSIVEEYPWIAENSQEVVADLEAYTFYYPSDKLWLVTADVVSLYTNINTKEGIQTINYVLKDRKDGEYHLNLLAWVLNNNYFKFGDNTYHQIQGTAMGTNLAPSYANLFVAIKERHLLIKYGLFSKRDVDDWYKFRARILYYKRYIDDCFMVINAENEEQLLDIMNDFNKISPSLQYKFERSLTKATFLDLSIFKGEKFAAKNQLDFSLFEKDINRHIFTDSGTHKPKNHVFGWLYGNMVRIARNSSDRKSFEEAKIMFQAQLLARGYPLCEIAKYTSFDYEQRSNYMVKKDKKTESSPFFHLLENDGTRPLLHSTLKRFNKSLTLLAPTTIPPIRIAVSKGRSLQDFLNRVQARILPNQITYWSENAGTSLGKRTRPPIDNSAPCITKAPNTNEEDLKEEIRRGKEKAP